MMYDVLEYVQKLGSHRWCEYCLEWYPKPALTEECNDCHSEHCCPACLQPLESELLKKTILTACAKCYLADIREMEGKRVAA